MIASMMDHIKNLKLLLDKKYSPKDRDPASVILSNKKYPPLEGGHFTKIGGMWTLKNGISSPKIY